MQKFYSHGKLLISGEYLVLKGALALAVPCKAGQHMEVTEDAAGEFNLQWINIDDKGEVWADVLLSKSDLMPYRHTLKTIDADVFDTLGKILKACRKYNPSFLQSAGSTLITNKLEFPRHAGLGSSSTLISNIATLAHLDAFRLNKEIFGGSGYDIACATSSGPVLYKLDDEGPAYDTVHFIPPQPDHIFFVHRGNKQHTQTAVKSFNDLENKFTEEIGIISELSEALLFCDDLADFMQLLDEHEEVMQFVLQEEKIKTKLFPDFNGAVKSLGAWGGDYFMAVSEMSGEEIRQYFLRKGYTEIFSYKEMVL